MITAIKKNNEVITSIKKNNDYNKTNIDIENKLVVTSGERKERRSKIGCEIKSYQLLCVK